VSTSSRTADVPELPSGFTTKVVPLVTSTIGGATSWELVPTPTAVRGIRLSCIDLVEVAGRAPHHKQTQASIKNG